MSTKQDETRIPIYGVTVYLRNSGTPETGLQVIDYTIVDAHSPEAAIWAAGKIRKNNLRHCMAREIYVEANLIQ